MSITPKLIEILTLQSATEREFALKYRQLREEKWQKTNNLYYGNKTKSLVSRANVHLPILHGAIETLLSKIDGSPVNKFEPQTTADQPKAAFLDKSIKLDAKLHAWDTIDIYSKKEALMYGRAIEKKYAYSDAQGFHDVRELVLCADFLIDPLAGGLNPFKTAKFCGQDNIIRTEDDLKAKKYNQQAVKDVLTRINSDSQADSRNLTHMDKKRAQHLDRFAYVSDDAVNLTEWFTTYKGTRYCVLFSPVAKIAVMVKKLKDMTEYNEYPYSSWAAFTDAEEFWSVAPAELFHDLNYIENILVSQLLDNSAQRNYGMKAYDTTKISNPAFLDPKPMGRIPVNGNPSEAIMDISFPSIGENLQLLNWLGMRLDADTGVTQNTRGIPNSKRMSAAEFTGLIDQVADRIYTHNRLYQAHYERICRLYAYGVWEFMSASRRIEVDGAMGVNNEVRNGSSLKFTSDFTVEVSLEEQEARSKAKEEQIAFIQRNRQNPNMNQIFLDEKEAMLIGFSEDDVKRLTTQLPDSDWRSFAEAKQENEDLLKKKVEPNRAASFTHVQAHMDFARYTRSLTDEQFKRVMEHAAAEMTIAQQNAELSVARMLQAQNAQAMAPQPQPVGVPTNTSQTL